MVNFLNTLNDFLWGTPFIVFVMAVGVYFTVKGKFFPFRYFGHIMKHTALNMTGKEANEKKEGKISPFEAFCIAVGSAVGTANISGVATAIATGGPGAVFWMWLWAFVGMMVKLVETALGLYYRTKDEKGAYSGGCMHYMERGIAGEMGKKIGIPLAALFPFSLFIQFVQGSQCYAIAEVLNYSFGLDMILVTLCYSAFVYYIIWTGTNRIANFACKLVPVMCVVYVLGGLVVIAANIGNIPSVFAMIFRDAFTGSAAFGGFMGAAVSKVISSGVSRSVYSNEAGMGTSPMVHGSADTIHPVRQGLWGSMEVFVDTLLVCTITALAVLSSGVWTSGQAGATLTIMGFETVFGRYGAYYIGIMTLLFGATTTAGWYTYYQTALAYLLRKWPKIKEKAAFIFKLIFPMTNIVIVSYIVFSGEGPELFWTIVSILTAPSTLINLFALLIIRKKFFAIFNDYKARYLGVGKVDPNFHVFYEDDPAVAAEDAKRIQELRAQA